MTELFSSANASMFLLVVVAICCALAALIFVLFTSLSQQRAVRALAQKLQMLEKQNSVLTSGSLGIGQRMLALEKKLRSLQDTQEDIRLNDVEFSYTQAQKLIAQGMDARTVAASSGLSASEVGLMQMLHNQAGC